MCSLFARCVVFGNAAVMARVLRAKSFPDSAQLCSVKGARPGPKIPTAPREPLGAEERGKKERKKRKEMCFVLTGSCLSGLKKTIISLQVYTAYALIVKGAQRITCFHYHGGSGFSLRLHPQRSLAYSEVSVLGQEQVCSNIILST